MGLVPDGVLIARLQGGEMNISQNNLFGLEEHCKAAALILNKMEINPHTKFIIRTAIREASLKVTSRRGVGKQKASHMSAAAVKRMEQGLKDDLFLEHVFPVSKINEMVLGLPRPTWQGIKDIVVEWSVLAVITKEENNRLKELGLSKSMPAGWDGKDKYARYIVAGIDLVPSKYSELARL